MTHTTRGSLYFTAIVSALLFLGSFSVSEAYFMTGQEAELLPDGSALFLIDYSFGVEKKEVHMPVLAHRTKNTSSDALSYKILDENGNEVTGQATGFVISKATMNDSGMYIVPKGIAKKFTLTVLFTPTVKHTGERYRLHVTHLPFSFNGTQQLSLNPSELSYYRTELTD